MSPPPGKTCIYPGCERPALPPHPLGGPHPSFCDLEDHNALSAHLERRRLARERAESEAISPGDDQPVNGYGGDGDGG
jgi:hypothetical protein